jgi:S1-C subfamily serine protease
MSRKYLASLAVAAVFILTVGIFVRDRLLRAQTPAPAPPSEASALQQLSQEGQLRRLSEFLSERVAAVAPLVAYVPDADATGVRWGQGDSLVTTLPTSPIVVVPAPAKDTALRSLVVAPDSARREWVLVVGRSPSGTVVSAAGILGGRTTARCGDIELTEYVVSAAIHDGFAGAGVFDLAGRTLGLIVRCNGRPVVTPMREVARVLADTGFAVTRMWGDVGLAVNPLTDDARAYFATDSGVLVTAVRRGSTADAAGLRPGDVLLAVDGRPVAAPRDLVQLGGASRVIRTVSRRRGDAVTTVEVIRTDSVSSPRTDSLRHSELGIDIGDSDAPRGVVIGTVRAGSAAAVAGLRAGDRLLRVGTRDVTSTTVARRLLIQRRTEATFIVFERDSVVRGVLLAR